MQERTMIHETALSPARASATASGHPGYVAAPALRSATMMRIAAFIIVISALLLTIGGAIGYLISVP
jgi:hypothetical protein